MFCEIYNIFIWIFFLTNRIQEGAAVPSLASGFMESLWGTRISTSFSGRRNFKLAKKETILDWNWIMAVRRIIKTRIPAHIPTTMAARSLSLCSGVAVAMVVLLVAFCSDINKNTWLKFWLNVKDFLKVYFFLKINITARTRIGRQKYQMTSHAK